MPLFATILAVIAIVVGLAGIVVPVLPGVLLIWAAVVGWAWAMGVSPLWPVLLAATLVYLTGLAAQALVPGRRMQKAGIPNTTLLVGVVAAVVGFFVIPVVGFVIGFVIGVWIAEIVRVGFETAKASTVRALEAAALSYGIELLTGLTLAIGWAVFATMHLRAGP